MKLPFAPNGLPFTNPDGGLDRSPPSEGRTVASAEHRSGNNKSNDIASDPFLKLPSMCSEVWEVIGAEFKNSKT